MPHSTDSSTDSSTDAMILTRRSALTMAVAGFGWRKLHAASPDFWNRKDPAEWSSEEIEKLMTKSPWAKQVRAEKSKTIKDPVDWADPAGMGKPRRMGKMGRIGKPSSSRPIVSYTGTVIWESARPIRDGLKSPVPDEFAGLYVLSVNGVPLAKLKSQDDDGAATASHGALERVRAVTTLRMKGRDPSQARVIQQQTDNGVVYLFGFGKDALPFTKDEKEVIFETYMGKLAFLATFHPKEMLYHGELAV